MIFGEWDWDVAKEVWQEEAREEGVVEGMEKGREEERSYIKSLLEQGLSGEEFLKQMKAEYALS
jgi:predicted transposase YdaD